MSSIIRRQSSSVDAANVFNAPSAAYTEGSTLNDVYEKADMAWEDVVHVLPPDAQSGMTIGSSIDSCTAVRKTSQNTFYQKRIVWRATPQAVTLYTLRRELTQLPNGKFKPREQRWSLVGTEVLNFLSPPTKREGLVPFSQSKKVTNSVHGQPKKPTVNETLMLLPATVQSHALKVIPTPTYEHGLYWQHWQQGNGENLPEKQTLEYIRLDGENVIVITAIRAIMPGQHPVLESALDRTTYLAQLPWYVTQTSGKIIRNSKYEAIQS